MVNRPDERGGVHRNRAAAAFRRVRERIGPLSAAVERTSDAIFMTDRAGTILYVNRAFERETGYSREEAVGATPRILKSGHYPDSYYAEMWRTLLSGREFRGTILNRRKDGSVFWGEQTITPVLSAHGEIQQFVSVIRDVTEREAELRYERDFNAAIVSTAGALVFVTDDRGRMIRFNRACEKVSGYGADEVIGRNLVDLPVVGPERPRWEERFGAALASEESVHEHLRWERREGGSAIVRWTLNALRDELGRATHVVASGIDVTESLAAHEALERRVAERTQELSEALAQVESLKERAEAENVLLREEVRRVASPVEIVGRSDAIVQTIRRMERVARTDTAVLLLGETGTGKGLFARALHECSLLRERPLVTVDCATLPESLIESELFGHEKGSFTGAVRSRPGRFELADGGTIFLDEIGDIPPAVQAKLLRVLQSGEFERVGSSTTRKVNVRVIAATNRELRAMTESGEFRRDLYFRLSVFPIHIPSLRERAEDIPDLARHFLCKHGWRLENVGAEICRDALAELVSYDWPGNVRELENTMQRAMILSTGGCLTVESLRAAIDSDHKAPPPDGQSLEDHDRQYIRGVLERCGWRIKGAGSASDRLGIPPSTLRDRMRKLGIRRSLR